MQASLILQVVKYFLGFQTREGVQLLPHRASREYSLIMYATFWGQIVVRTRQTVHLCPGVINQSIISVVFSTEVGGQCKPFAWTKCPKYCIFLLDTSCLLSSKPSYVVPIVPIVSLSPWKQNCVSLFLCFHSFSLLSKDWFWLNVSNYVNSCLCFSPPACTCKSLSGLIHKFALWSKPCAGMVMRQNSTLAFICLYICYPTESMPISKEQSSAATCRANL